MTRDDIIRMARLSVIDLYAPMPDEKMYDVFIERCAKFAHLVAAAEREECAKLLEEMAAADNLTNRYQVAALVIRARGDK
jgi:hypothetical protein